MFKFCDHILSADDFKIKEQIIIKVFECSLGWMKKCGYTALRLHKTHFKSCALKVHLVLQETRQLSLKICYSFKFYLCSTKSTTEMISGHFCYRPGHTHVQPEVVKSLVLLYITFQLVYKFYSTTYNMKT